MGKIETNEHRSTTFSMLMKVKKYALEIYNVLNGTDYDDPDEVEIMELDGGVTLSVRNDAAFIVDSVLNLYEHQSTTNPNMPLRQLIYTAAFYRQFIKEYNRNIYGSALIKLPAPKYVVFYNGLKNFPEEQELRLSQAYEVVENNPQLELVCRVLNINPGFNEKLKNSCEPIRGYCTYVDKAREKSKTMDTESAIRSAIDYCIREGILVDFFRENKEMIITADAIDCTLEAKERIIEDQNRTIEEQRGVIAENKKAIAENKRAIAEDKKALREKDNIIAELKAANEQLTAELERRQKS